MNPENPTQYRKDLEKYLASEDFIKWKELLNRNGIDKLYAQNILILAYNEGYGAALDHVNNKLKKLTP